MKTIDIYVFPFQKGTEMVTRLFIDKQEINNPDNRLTQFVVKKPMNKWLKSYKRKLFVWKGFFYELALELNASDYEITFYGQTEDFQIFSEEILLQKELLEMDGRSTSLKIDFVERFSARKATEVMINAYDGIIYKAYKEENYNVSRNISSAKKELTTVPCELKCFGTIPEEFEQPLLEGEFINCRSKHPKVLLIIFGTDSAENIYSAVSGYMNGKSYDNTFLLFPEEMRCEKTDDCINRLISSPSLDEGTLHAQYYSDNPIGSVEECIYSYYMPRIITEAISEFYKDIRSFEDFESDAYILEAIENIDSLFN